MTMKFVRFWYTQHDVQDETKNYHVVSSDDAQYIVLRLLAYPCRYCDITSKFGRSVFDHSLTFNQLMIFFFHVRFSHLFSAREQTFFSSENLINLQMLFRIKKLHLTIHWKVSGGTVRACWRSDKSWKVFYDKHRNQTFFYEIMSNFCVPIESFFGNFVRYFLIVDFKKTMRNL